MPIKWIGAVMIIAGCGGFGFYLAVCYRREEQLLERFCKAMLYMINELEYHRTELPTVLADTAKTVDGPLSQILSSLSAQLQERTYTCVSECMHDILRRYPSLPVSVKKLLEELGDTLGHFDLSGQLMSLNAVMDACVRKKEDLARDRQVRIRNYQTLGLCAGAALAILLI